MYTDICMLCGKPAGEVSFRGLGLCEEHLALVSQLQNDHTLEFVDPRYLKGMGAAGLILGILADLQFHELEAGRLKVVKGVNLPVKRIRERLIHRKTDNLELRLAPQGVFRAKFLIRGRDLGYWSIVARSVTSIRYMVQHGEFEDPGNPVVQLVINRQPFSLESPNWYISYIAAGVASFRFMREF